jgi:zinc/manganese transport system permease protein
VESEAGYWYAFAFAIGGAALFALARPHENLLQQEAAIGIVYVVSASIGVLALDRAPQGAEHIKQLLIGVIELHPIRKADQRVTRSVIHGLQC